VSENDPHSGADDKKQSKPSPPGISPGSVCRRLAGYGLLAGLVFVCYRSFIARESDPYPWYQIKSETISFAERYLKIDSFNQGLVLVVSAVCVLFVIGLAWAWIVSPRKK